jgi:NAD(P)-dependent dehydrogenase (short-subunit alcohol dehydrogenase family)
MTWSVENLPPQDGRVAVVTGANGGLGLATARALAGAGAHVVMAARNQDKAVAARDDILATHPDASLELVELDLGSLASVEAAAKAILDAHDRVDLLVNNAGLMAMPQGRTEDGFDTQFGVNHLGHWALTSHLLPTIVRTPGARVVTVCSTAQHLGRAVDPEDPHMRDGYEAWRMYGQSKLANRHFAVGLQRQLEAAGVDARSLTAHPGLTHSDLQGRTVREGGGGPLGPFFHAQTRLMGMSTERGALSQLRAATDPDAPGGAMFGPLFGASGPPVRKPLVRPGTDAAIRTLWEVSRRETGLDVNVAAALRGD